MKIICVSGEFCSGKTTAIDIMANHLPNSAIIHGDNFLNDALINHEKEFKEIYNVALDLTNPTASLRAVNNNLTSESIKTYIEFCNIFMPYIENKIEKIVAENREQGKNFVIVEYVSLPSFKIWESADFRIMIVPNQVIRKTKLYERTIAKREYNEDYEYIRKSAFKEIIENAKNIDFNIINYFDENFEKDLISSCREIKNKS